MHPAGWKQQPVRVRRTGSSAETNNESESLHRIHSLSTEEAPMLPTVFDMRRVRSTGAPPLSYSLPPLSLLRLFVLRTPYSTPQTRQAKAAKDPTALRLREQATQQGGPITDSETGRHTRAERMRRRYHDPRRHSSSATLHYRFFCSPSPPLAADPPRPRPARWLEL